jgi:hypothetical protein
MTAALNLCTFGSRFDGDNYVTAGGGYEQYILTDHDVNFA